MLALVHIMRQSNDAPVPDFLAQRRPTMADAAEPSDEELVLQARAGSKAAFESLVRRHQKQLFFLCLRYVHDRDVAADVTQRAFIRVMEKIHDLRDAQIFRSWLFRIGINLSLNHLRDHARFVEEDANFADETNQPETHTVIEASQTSDAVRRAVEQLPTKQRITLELRVYEELSFREIAHAMSTTENAAKVNFHYAVRRLRGLLNQPASGKVGKS